MSYVDVLRRTVAFAVVVYAIFYVTLDALDMLRGVALTFVIKLLVFHF